jgi:hypothetical protein
MTDLGPCECCRAPAAYTVLLVVNPDGYHLPDQVVRVRGWSGVKHVAFCGDCLRNIEDELRAVINKCKRCDY